MSATRGGRRTRSCGSTSSASRPFAASVLGGSLFRIGVGAIPFLLPLMLQIGFGLNPLQSGLLTFVSAAGALFMKTLAARILRTLRLPRPC